MDRRNWIKRLAELGVCTGALSIIDLENNNAYAAIEPDKELEQVKAQKEFIQNWLSDLLESMDKVIDRETQVKIIEGCGKGCFNRHKFKQDIAEKGKGSLDNLIAAYKQNYEIWKDGDTVHIRYGEVSSQCYCPAANYRAPEENDLHCECTRMTHQTIFETALEKKLKVDIIESLRRGGKTCHFLVHLA